MGVGGGRCQHVKWQACFDGAVDNEAAAAQGRDAGELKLRMTYVPLPRCNPLVGDYGALFVYIRKGRDFPRMIASVEHSCNPYYIGKVGDMKEEGQPVNNTTVRAARRGWPPAILRSCCATMCLQSKGSFHRLCCARSASQVPAEQAAVASLHRCRCNCARDTPEAAYTRARHHHSACAQDPDWGNAKLDFYNVPNTEELRIKFKNKNSGVGSIANSDEDLGYVNIEIKDVRHSKHRGQRGSSFGEYELQDADSGYVTIECLFVAYF
jgi:hypothetical protein